MDNFKDLVRKSFLIQDVKKNQLLVVKGAILNSLRAGKKGGGHFTATVDLLDGRVD